MRGRAHLLRAWQNMSPFGVFSRKLQPERKYVRHRQTVTLCPSRKTGGENSPKRNFTHWTPEIQYPKGVAAISPGLRDGQSGSDTSYPGDNANIFFSLSS